MEKDIKIENTLSKLKERLKVLDEKPKRYYKTTALFKFLNQKTDKDDIIISTATIFQVFKIRKELYDYKNTFVEMVGEMVSESDGELEVEDFAEMMGMDKNFSKMTYNNVLVSEILDDLKTRVLVLKTNMVRESLKKDIKSLENLMTEEYKKSKELDSLLEKYND